MDKWVVLYSVLVFRRDFVHRKRVVGMRNISGRWLSVRQQQLCVAFDLGINQSKRIPS